MSLRLIRWILLLTMIFSVPLAYFMIAIVGILTFAHIVLLSVHLHGLLLDPALLVLTSFHLIAYGAALYLAAGWIARRILKLEEYIRPWAVSGCVLLIIAVGLLPIFNVAVHGTPKTMNAYALLFSDAFH